MSLALGVHLTARTIAIRPVDRKILSTSINERIVLVRQKGNNGAASYDHPLLSYAKHVLQKPLDSGAGIATLAKRPQGRIEGDDIVKALGRIIKLGDIRKTGRYSHILQTADESGTIVVSMDIIVNTAQGKRPACYVQDTSLEIYAHLFQVISKSQFGCPSAAGTTHHDLMHL